MKRIEWVWVGSNPEEHQAHIKCGGRVWTATTQRHGPFVLIEVKSESWIHTKSLQQAKRLGNAILRALAGDAK